VVLGELGRSLIGAHLNSGDLLPPSGSVRPALYADCLGHATTTPLGIGIGRFESDYPEWRSLETARRLSQDGAALHYRTPKTPHSEPLLLLLEFGWVGGALLLVGFWRLARRRSMATTPGVPLLSSPALTALLVAALVRSPFSDNPTALALASLLLGLDLGRARTLRLDQPLADSGTAPVDAKGRLLPSAAVGSLALLTMWPSWPQLRGEQLMAAAVAEEEDPAALLVAATEARPWDKQAWVLLGLYYVNNERWQWARSCYTEALLHDPAHLPALLGLIRVELAAPDGDEMILVSLLARAEQVAPSTRQVVALRVAWLEAHRQRFEREAVRRVQQGIPGAGAWWAATYLAEAQIAAAEQRWEDSREALFRASAVVPREKGLVERTARREQVSQETIGKLTRQVFPTWPKLQ
jgi:tetratricopeptide (TPR) repeat protein